MAQPIQATHHLPSWGGGTPSGTPSGTPVIACTRFNNKTWQEYQTWMSTYQPVYEEIYQRPLKCIYGCPREISSKKIAPQAQILVIEMNNDENRIMGIGEIQNQTASEVYRTAAPPSRYALNPAHNAAHNAHNRTKLPSLGGGPPFRKIFSDRNYTRYIYIGNSHYATREELERNHTPDAQYMNEQLINIMPQTPHSSSPQPFIIESLERLLFKGAKHMKRGSGITRCFMKQNCIPQLHNFALRRSSKGPAPDPAREKVSETC
jgi:hypothetical protein